MLKSSLKKLIIVIGVLTIFSQLSLCDAQQLTAEQWLARGNLYQANHYYDKAISAYTEALNLNPWYALAYYERGLTYIKEVKFTQAFSDFNKAIEFNPTLADAYYYRGLLDFFQAPANESSDFNKAIELNPKDAQAYCGLGFYYYFYGEYEQAIVAYGKALALNPAYADRVYFYRGKSFFEKRQYKKAISDFSKAISINPHNAKYYSYRDIAYIEIGNYKQAQDSCDRAIKINPRNAWYYYQKAFIESGEKNYNQSIADCTKTIELMPDFLSNATFFNLRGNDYAHLGEYTKAIHDFNKAIKLFPEKVDSRFAWICYFNLAQALELTGDKIKAVEYYKMAMGVFSGEKRYARDKEKIQSRLNGDWNSYKEWI
jgi:tetratricopeptide (TPR) repeat protein